MLLKYSNPSLNIKKCLRILTIVGDWTADFKEGHQSKKPDLIYSKSRFTAVLQDVKFCQRRKYHNNKVNDGLDKYMIVSVFIMFLSTVSLVVDRWTWYSFIGIVIFTWILLWGSYIFEPLFAHSVLLNFNNLQYILLSLVFHQTRLILKH